MKIMIFNSLYYPYRVGGAEISVQLLAEELADRGNTVRVVTLHEKATRELKILNGVTVVSLPLRNIYWPFDNKKHAVIKRLAWHLIDTFNLFMYKSVLKEINDFSPDVVHTNNLSGFSVCVWNAVKHKNVKLLHTSRDYYLFHPNSTLFNGGKNVETTEKSVVFWSWLKKRCSRKVDVYIGISNYIAELHKENGFFPNSMKKVIYNSVPKIECTISTNQSVRVGFLGRLSYEKGFDEYCNLAGEYKDDCKYEFLSAGNFQDDTSKKVLGKLAQENNVNICGYMDLMDFLNSIDIVVLPIKWNEPFGRTIVECALAGKVVVTTPVGALCELSSIMNNIIISDNLSDGFKKGVSTLKNISVPQRVVDIFKPEEIAREYYSTYSDSQGNKIN